MNEYSYKEMKENCRIKLDNLVQAFHAAPTTNIFIVLNNEDQSPMKEVKLRLAELGGDNVYYIGAYENAGETPGYNDVICPIDEVPQMFWEKCLPFDKTVKKHITLITDISQDTDKLNNNILMFFQQFYDRCGSFLGAVMINSIVTLNIVLALPDEILPNNLSFAINPLKQQSNQGNQDKYDEVKRRLMVCTNAFNRAFHTGASLLDTMRFPDCGIILRRLSSQENGTSEFVNELYYLTLYHFSEDTITDAKGRNPDLELFKQDDMPWLTYSTGLTDDTLIALMNAVVHHIEILEHSGNINFAPPSFSDFRNLLMSKLGYSKQLLQNGFKLDHEIDSYKNYQPSRVFPPDINPNDEDHNSYWDNRFNQQSGTVASEGTIGANYIPTRTDHVKSPDADKQTVYYRALELYDRVDAREAMHLMLACSANPLSIGMPKVNQQNAAQGIVNCFREFANATAMGQPNADLVFSSLMNIYAAKLSDMQMFYRDYEDMTERIRTLLTDLKDNNLVPAKKYLSPKIDIFDKMTNTEMLSKKTLSQQFVEYLSELSKNQSAAAAFTSGLEAIKKDQGKTTPDIGAPEFTIPGVPNPDIATMVGKDPIDYLSEKMYYKMAKANSLKSFDLYFEQLFAVKP